MRTGQKHTISKLYNNRGELRKNLTPAEATLWSLINNKQLQGRKFRRQHSIGNFIVDFYCSSEKLIIELDGEVHNDPAQASYDKKRNEQLILLGYKVLRFENKMVFQQTAALLHSISSAFACEA